MKDENTEVREVKKWTKVSKAVKGAGTQTQGVECQPLGAIFTVLMGGWGSLTIVEQVYFVSTLCIRNQHFSQCPDHLQQCISKRLFSSYVCLMQLVLVREKDADHLSSYLPCQNWTVPAPCTQSLSENTKSHQEKAGTGCLSFPQTISVVLFDSKCLITFQIYF